MSAGDARTRKLLLAAASLADAEAALVLCRAILELSPAKPTGLIIVSESAGIWAGRTHRIVTTSGALLAVPSLEQAQRIARSDVRALEARLAELAAALSTDWACGLSSGELVREAFAAIEGNDILVLGQRPMLRQRGKVLLLGPDASPAARALAEALARATGTVVEIIEPGGEDAVARVDRSHAGAVVVDCETFAVESEEELGRLVAAARCPVAVLGGSRVRRGRAAAPEA